ncbi:hypothetical protein DYBT9275_04129 [Dyadobacter sp. CECT 9275]|uniref:RNA polymerase sigma-70 factor n=1 Tax=Dyadobacter helix TaxID=2822344 RepID=A0A916JHJ2_9BACT|nr:RNA polymerase sigma-70 factor [Dyadobacter sp. CECT 9275]CAG5007801.1 hypothetical protein DYBT9275_04129 [Dyadobacter sp. CECT 9275]
MQDSFFYQETDCPVPFLSHHRVKRAATGEIDSTIFLRSAFETNPANGLELLFLRYYQPLCSHAVRFVYSKQIAEDLVSEVFFQFYRTQAYLNISTSYTSYLFRSVRNECYTYMKQEFGKMDSLDITEVQPFVAHSQQPDAEMHFNNLFLKINEVIEELPAQCRKVFLLSRFEDKKYHQIARECHISPKTVEVHISKALRQLRTALRGDWLLAAGFFSFLFSLERML